MSFMLLKKCRIAFGPLLFNGPGGTLYGGPPFYAFLAERFCNGRTRPAKGIGIRANLLREYTHAQNIGIPDNNGKL